MVTVVRITVMPTEYRKVLHDVPRVAFTTLLGKPDDRTVAHMKDLQNLHVCRFDFKTDSYNWHLPQPYGGLTTARTVQTGLTEQICFLYVYLVHILGLAPHGISNRRRYCRH
jgi:hypothetical protein